MRFTLAALLLLLIAAPANAQLDGNNDEAKVPAYTLPDPLRFADGTPVRSPRDWQRRRAKLVRLFEQNVYGFAPPAPRGMRFRVTEQGPAFAEWATPEVVVAQSQKVEGDEGCGGLFGQEPHP